MGAIFNEHASSDLSSFTGLNFIIDRDQLIFNNHFSLAPGRAQATGFKEFIQLNVLVRNCKLLIHLTSMLQTVLAGCYFQVFDLISNLKALFRDIGDIGGFTFVVS